MFKPTCTLKPSVPSASDHISHPLEPQPSHIHFLCQVRVHGPLLKQLVKHWLSLVFHVLVLHLPCTSPLHVAIILQSPFPAAPLGSLKHA